LTIEGKCPEDVLVDVNTLCNAIDIADYYKEQAIYAYRASRPLFLNTELEIILSHK